MGTRLEVTAKGAVPAALVQLLQTELADRSTLQDVLAWAFAQTPPRDVTEVVVQDEYTHDVVIAVEERRALVFDCT